MAVLLPWLSQCPKHDPQCVDFSLAEKSLALIHVAPEGDRDTQAPSCIAAFGVTRRSSCFWR
jgi:hypothetical protein